MKHRGPIRKAVDRKGVRHVVMGATCAVGVSAAFAEDTTPPKTVAEAVHAALEEITVTATRFNTNELTAVSKMPQAAIETSQSAKTLSADELSFAGVVNLSDIGKLDSGQYISPVNVDFVIQNYFRGFAGTCGNFPVKIDGFRTNCEAGTDLTPYARVEILKGASSSVYGQSNVAGTMVLVSKQPEKTFGGIASIEAGAFRHAKLELDIHGSLTNDERLYGRLIVTGLNENMGFKDASQRYVTVAPSLKYDFDSRDSLTWLMSYTHSDKSVTAGFPLAFNASGPGGAANGANYSIPDIPYSVLGFLQPSWSQQLLNWTNTSLTYDHLFNNDWHLKVGSEYALLNNPVEKYVWVGAYSPISADKTAKTNTYLYWGTERDPQYAGEVNLFGDVEAFGHKQTLFFGADYTHYTISYRPYVGDFLSGSKTGFNAYQLNWNTIPNISSLAAFLPGGPYANPGYATAYNRYEINEGAEFGALLRPSDDLTINIGTRYTKDVQNVARVCCSYPPPTLDGVMSTPLRPTQIKWTYQVGANYALTQGIHAYASYGTTFEAANKYAYNPAAPSSAGTFLGPQKGATAEVGLKGESKDKLINWSVDIFDTSITNSFQQDPSKPQFSISTGAERATGFESEIQGKFSRSWDLTVSASSTKNVFTDGPLKGIWSPFAVKFGLSVFSAYEFLEGPLRGFGVGGGYVHKTRAPYVLNNGADLSGLFKNQNEVDLRLFYDAKPWRFTLFVNNVTNERLVSPRDVNFIGGGLFINQPVQIFAQAIRGF